MGFEPTSMKQGSALNLFPAVVLRTPYCEWRVNVGKAVRSDGYVWAAADANLEQVGCCSVRELPCLVYLIAPCPSAAICTL